MTDKEAIDNLKNYIECLMEDYGYYKDIVEFRDSVEHLEKSLQTQQAEIKEYKKIIAQDNKEYEHMKKSLKGIISRSNAEIDSLKDFKEIAESKVTDLNPIGLARTNQLLSRQCHKLQEEIEKKDKIIDLMAYDIATNDSDLCQYIDETIRCKKYAGENKLTCDECIKQYFERKVEE